MAQTEVKAKPRPQPSKKGKRAWRKNIDIKDIEDKLDERRQEIIEEGKPVDELEASELFYIDEEEDEHTVKKMKRDHIKPLKSTEILYQRSKAPGLVNKRAESRRRRVENVTGREIHRLMKISGKVQGVSRFDAGLERDGIVRAGAHDPWADPKPSTEKSKKKKREVPEILQKYSGNSFTPAKVAPKTMKLKPLASKGIQKVPEGGKSYNPSFSSWKALIQQEFFIAKTDEDKKAALEKERERLQYIIDNFDDHGEIEEEEDESANGKDEAEDEEDGEEAEEEQKPENKYRLSINPATGDKIKTKTKRNRQKREKERQRLLSEMKKLKETIQQIEKLPKIIEQEKKRAQEIEKKKSKTKLRKLPSSHIAELPMEVKLSDELDDSLRKLVPEGHLLAEQMIKLQSSGKIEAKRHITKRKPKRKLTQKWSYKDFK